MDLSNTELHLMLKRIDRHDFQPLENNRFPPRCKSKNRPAEYYQAFCEKTYQRYATVTPEKSKFQLYSLNSSTLDLLLYVFPWVKCRSTKNDIKYRIVERCPINKSKGGTSDQTIFLTSPKGKDGPHSLTENRISRPRKKVNIRLAPHLPLIRLEVYAYLFAYDSI